MQMKPSLEKLKVIMAYAVENIRQDNMFSGRMQNVSNPQGEIHIFELNTININDREKIIEPSRFALCGKTRSEIGEQTKDSDKRPLGLPMCSTCEAKWKAHPNSPWRKWQTGEKI